MAVNLKVPYKSQWDADAKGTQNDCGPASVAMILGYFGLAVTTDAVYEKTGAGAGLIGIAQMEKAIKALGYTTYRKVQSSLDEIRKVLDSGLPVIALVHYGSMGSGRQDDYTGAHFLVVRGYKDGGFYLNDPNFWDSMRSKGENWFIAESTFLKAWNDAAKDGNQARSFQVINPKAGQTPGGGSMGTELEVCLVDRKKFWDERDAALAELTTAKTKIEELKADVDKAKKQRDEARKERDDLKSELSGEKKASETIKGEHNTALEKIAEALGSTADLASILKFIEMNVEDIETLRVKAKQLESELAASQESKQNEINQLKKELEELRAVNARQATHIEQLEKRVNSIEVSTESLQPLWAKVADFVTNVLASIKKESK